MRFTSADQRLRLRRAAPKPGHAFGRWTEHMRRGRYAAAWRISDRLMDQPSTELPRHLRMIWRGAPPAGSDVTVRCYRGLGDTLQFVRYIPMVRAVARRVTVCAQRELLPLLAIMPGIDRLLPLEAEPPLGDAAVEIEATELPHVFRTTVDTIPALVPYLHAPRVPLPSGNGLKVGIVWAAGPWDERRTLAPGDLAALTGIPDVTLYSFQRGAAAADAREIGACAPEWRDTVQEAGMLRSLDLLITVDTMPAHLAGALAVPVWLLLHSEPDWRWMACRNDSPWYPTMRLFRQERAGEWQPVVQQVATELRSLRRDWR